jgi:hypothetical protein
VIRDVNVAEQSLTIDSTTGDLVRLLVSDGTRISLNDRPAELEDLHRGFRVSAVFVETTHLAIRIAAHSLGEVTGHIREVDTSASTVVIVPLVDGPAVELHVSRETEIRIGDRPAELRDLLVGMAAHAVFNIVSLDALSIQARPLPGGGDDCSQVRAAGAIARVNVDEHTLTLDPADSREFLTLNVLERTTITLNGRAARLSDLRAGMRAEVVFCRESLVARSIAASAPDGTR